MNFQLENKNVYASDAGQGIDQNKETIVFLHGSGLSHIVWSLTEQFFSNNNFNVLSIDLPGHGNSDGPCLDSIEKIADWLEQVFNKLNLNKIKKIYIITGLDIWINDPQISKKQIKLLDNYLNKKKIAYEVKNEIELSNRLFEDFKDNNFSNKKNIEDLNNYGEEILNLTTKEVLALSK